MKMPVAITLIVAAGAFSSAAPAEQKLQKLTAGQIRAKFAGMELTDQVHWRELYARNGTVASNSMGRKRTGKWRVEKGQLCIEFEKEPANCYEVWLAGKNVPLEGVLEPAGVRGVQ